MRIIKNPEDRKNEILDAAKTLFMTKGYVKTTVNDILQATGIAKGTFYYYFQSKEEVMDAVVERLIDIAAEAAQNIASDPALPATEKLRRIVAMPEPEAKEKDRMIDEFHQTENAEMHQRSLVQTVLRLSPILAQIIEQGIREGTFHTSCPRETIELLLVASQFLLDDGLFHWQPEELTKKARAFALMMETSLGAEPGSFDYIYERYAQIAKHQAEGGQ